MQVKNYIRHLQWLIPVVIGISLLFFPLVGEFHFESAFLVSLIGCCWAGLRACDQRRALTNDFYTALQIAGYLFLVGLPLLFGSVAKGCFSLDGLAFWLLLPLPSIFFGYAIGRLFRSWQLPFRRLLTVMVLLGVGVGVFLYELLNYPQLYFYNHVWGGWPGPIYDEVVQVEQPLVFFRMLTLLWATLLWHIPLLQSEKFSRWIVFFSTVSLLLGYAQMTERGVISPRPHLQQMLGENISTPNFELYYDPELYSPTEIEMLAQEHEFFLEQISTELQLSANDSTRKIESYLYGHPWQKKKLTGAKFTSFVPVWLEQDQLHIAKQQIPHSLKHELVHVLTKQFGNTWFNASWSVGLIEGIAVALSGGTSTSTIDHIVAADEPYPTDEELRSIFSPLGFYGGRANVNYLTGGSFVKHLIRNYSAEDLKQAYKTGNIPEAFEKDWEELVSEWHSHLHELDTDFLDQTAAGRLFGIPSLFEQECPRVMTKEAAAWDQYQYHLARNDTASAVVSLAPVIKQKEDTLPELIKADWSYYQLLQGNIQEVQQAASFEDSTADMQLIAADAYALADSVGQAGLHLQRAQLILEKNPDSLLAPALQTRKDEWQWQVYRQLTYKHHLPDMQAFDKANHRTKIRSVQKAMDADQWSVAMEYIDKILQESLQLRYFDQYLPIIHRLAFFGEKEAAMDFIHKLSVQKLRPRHQELLNQEEAWIKYVSG